MDKYELKKRIKNLMKDTDVLMKCKTDMLLLSRYNINNYKYVYLEVNNLTNINNYVYEVKIKKENKKPATGKLKHSGKQAILYATQPSNKLNPALFQSAKNRTLKPHCPKNK